MKVSVFIKVAVTFLIISMAFMGFFFHYMKSVEVEIVVNSEKVISHGLLNTLENKLTKTAKSQWPTLIKEEYKQIIQLVPIESLGLNRRQKEQLHTGQVVVATGPGEQFLNLVIAKKTAYKRVAHSSFVLVYDYARPVDVVAHYMLPVLKAIARQVLATPKENRQPMIKKLEKVYGYPIHFYKKNHGNIPAKIQQLLLGDKVAYTLNKNTTQIGIIYYDYGEGVIKIGPIRYSAIMARISDVIGYFIIAFFLFCFVIMTVLSVLFIKNLKKIFRMTERFSQGDFAYREPLRFSSVLHGLYINIRHMGERLNELIESNKRMCRFIAHEIRTPLSTIQMATDSLIKKRADDDFIQRQCQSIQEDVTDMNNIVSTFLIYSKMLATDISLKRAEFDLIEWLNKLLKPYQTSPLTLQINDNNLRTMMVNADANLLKHAVTNLLSNAMKFAKNEIDVSIEQHNGQCLIHVDDDGPGLTGEDIDSLFTEYNTAVEMTSDNKHIGLGLAIVKKVMALHGGSVTAKPSPTKDGARFTLTII